jgi:hypothetical protein
MIEANWRLPPLTVRDATAANLADELDFAHPRANAPRIDAPAGPFGIPCPSEGPGNGLSEAAQLRALAQQAGFPLP